jgi:uncharacterized membrane protein YeaQ/YmgE (transglycosylase-associated protein family)
MHQDPIDPHPAGQREGRAWYAGCVPPRQYDALAVAFQQARPERYGPAPSPSEGSMSIVAWIVLGLIAGAIAKALMPGNDPGGFIVTILIGIVGAFLGGFLGNMIADRGLNGFSVWSIILAIVGAMLLLWIYRMATRGRAPRV